MEIAIAKGENYRSAEISIRLSEFEIPPMKDVLLIGKRAPIGPEAAKRMVDALSPEQYEIIPVHEGPLEALIVRKPLLNIIPREKLLSILMDEGLKITSENMLIKAQISVAVIVKRQIDF